MLIEKIREAKAAADIVKDTKRAIQNVGGLRSSSGLGGRYYNGCYNDPVAEAIQLRERLQEKLKNQELFAAECQEAMMDELSRVPSAVTRKIFLCRYYDGCKWNVVSQRVGISIQAAKMRCYRYLETESGHAS